MRKDRVISEFLKKRRLELKKTQQAIADVVGIAGVLYSQWERAGYIPKDHGQLEKLAAALKTTTAELLEMTKTDNSQQDVLSLIRVIAQSHCTVMTVADFRFLAETQEELTQPMSPTLVEELMKHRTEPEPDGAQSPPPTKTE